MARGAPPPHTRRLPERPADPPAGERYLPGVGADGGHESALVDRRRFLARGAVFAGALATVGRTRRAAAGAAEAVEPAPGLVIH